MKRFLCFSGAVLLAFAATPARANDFEAELQALTQSSLREIATAPEIIAAIKEQNSKTATLEQTKINELDQIWRQERDMVDQPLIESVMATSASLFLLDKRNESNGLFSEIIVMDAKGLNVALSDMTSDYWQGDEDKWTKTYLVGPNAVHIGDLEEDESTQALQSQISLSVTDPETGAVIGAITFGINVGEIE